jgi:hypothetical protein
MSGWRFGQEEARPIQIVTPQKSVILSSRTCFGVVEGSLTISVFLHLLSK